MSNREKQEVLKELNAKNIPVYSYSRLECINSCPFEAYLTYIKGWRNKQEQNVYSSLGGKIHDTLEDIMNGKATTDDLLPAMNSELETLDMLGIEFPKGRDGSDSIRQGWVDDMTHFCKTYRPPKGQFETEQFFLYKTPGGNYMQGYIDLLRHNIDGSVDIYDYKTSTMYKGADLAAHGKQLLLYALAKEQEGYAVRRIAWFFLKYCDVKYVGKKTSKSKEKTEIKKTIERKKLVKELLPVIEEKLREMNVFSEFIVEEALETNTIPEILTDQFTVTPCVVTFPLNDETRQEAIKYFDETIKQWEATPTIEENYDHRPFTKIQKNGKETEDTFYCGQLCGYKRICPHYLRFVESRTQDLDDEFADLF